jgi:hypothetical protein
MLRGNWSSTTMRAMASSGVSIQVSASPVESASHRGKKRARISASNASDLVNHSGRASISGALPNQNASTSSAVGKPIIGVSLNLFLYGAL